MKKIPLTIALILSAICSFGQQGFAVKIYQNTDLFKVKYTDRTLGTTTTTDHLNFSRISIAGTLHTRNDFVHELELFIPEINESLDDIKYPMNYEFRKGDTFEGQATTYSFRYEFGKAWTSESRKFGFFLGAGINPYYTHIEYTPENEFTYYSSTKVYGGAFNVIPRVNYKLSRRINIEINVPLKVYDLRWEKNRVDNPAIPIRQQQTEDFDDIFFESAYTIRFGLIYLLTK
jgi:hypothetical protein